MSVQLSIIIPSYNTSNLVNNLIEVIEVAKSITSSYEIIIVNDGSKNFPKIKQDEYIKVITNKKNMGKGYSLIKGFKKAQGEIICFIDVDLQIPAITLFSYYKIMMGSRSPDVLIGSKRHHNSSIDYGLVRRLMSFGLQIINRLLFGFIILDTQCGAKMFKRKVIKDILPLLCIDGFAIDVEILSLSQIKGYKIIQAPVIVNKSFNSTVKIWSVGKVMWDILRIWSRRKFKIKGGIK